jgi:hypothetical protein
VEGAVISLQYTDDIILFMDMSEEHAVNLKCILTRFEMMSGMRIVGT